MSTTELYMDLSQANSWLSGDEVHSALSGSYEQSQVYNSRLTSPKVLWSMNALPFTGGIKSINFSSSEYNADIGGGADLPAYYEVSNSPDLGTMIDAEGEAYYRYISGVSSFYEGGTSYSVATNGEWKELMTDIGVFHRATKIDTVFQTKTVIMLSSSYTLDPTITLDNALTGSDVMIYNASTHSAEIYNLIGIDINPVGALNDLSITSYGNYLLFWDTDRLYWSSPIDFTDFTPSVGGGGSTQISEAKGPIVIIVPNPTGLMIYCKLNIIHAAFSGDSSNPWIFTEVAGSSGVLVHEGGSPIVTQGEVASTQIAMLSNGLSSVSPNGVELIDPALDEMLNNLSTEYKDEGSNLIRRAAVPSPVLQAHELSTKVVALKYVGNYLVVKVGRSNMGPTEVVDFPNELNRLFFLNLGTGQLAVLKGNYTAITPALNTSKRGASQLYPQDFIPNRFLAALRGSSITNSNVNLVDIDLGKSTEAANDLITADSLVATAIGMGEFIVGNIQLSRSKTTVIHSIKLDGRLHSDSTEADRCAVRVYDAGVLGHDNPIEFIYNPADGRHYGHIEGKELQVEVTGANFYLTGMAIEVEQGGNW